MSSESPLIIALDFPNAKTTLKFLNKIQGMSCNVKVGLELFIAEGPALVEQLLKLEHQVFLDLKLHDIPNTVASAVKSACNLGVWMMTLHAAGGNKMLQFARDVAKKNTKLIAVTVLTSMDQSQLKSIGINVSTMQQVEHLVNLAIQGKMDGIVCSAQEVETVRNSFGNEIIVVTPGIRLVQDSVGDQKRIATPQLAKQSGSNYMVVGRPITRSEDPILAINQYLESWNSTSSVLNKI